MAASASGIRAGRAYVELGAKTDALAKGLKDAEKRLKSFGDSVKAVGRQLAGVGLAAAAPLAASTKAFADFEGGIASLRAAANPTAEQLEQINARAIEISKLTGVGPAKVAAAMTELLKAGLPLDKVLSDATAQAVKFAKVAEMEVPAAAVALTDAMLVFGVDAATAVDTLSRAADASSVSLDQVTQSFSQASAVAKLAGLTIDETANAIAILGQAGVKGSDAGTSLKTMLLRLLAPVDEGAKAVEALGINVRDSSGNMKDMRGIIAELQAKLGGLGPAAEDAAMRSIFGSDAIRAGAILLDRGTAGWDEFNGKMAGGLTVTRKYTILMDTLGGAVQGALAALERLGIVVGEALAPTLREWGEILGGVVAWITEAARNNKDLIVSVAKGAVALIAGGAALIAFGAALSTVATIVGGVAAVVTALSSPLGAILAGLAGLTAALAVAGGAWLVFTESGQAALGQLGSAFATLRADAVLAFEGIAAALKKGDIALAGKILWAALAVEWQRGVNFLNAVWQDWSTAFKKVFMDASFEVTRIFADFGSGIELAFARVFNFIESAWDDLTGGMSIVWLKFSAFVTKELIKIQGLMSGRFLTDMAGIARELLQVDEGVNQQIEAIGENLEKRSEGRRDRVAGVEARRQANREVLDEAQKFETEQLFGRSRDSVAAGEAELRKRQDELNALVAEARSGVGGGTAEEKKRIVKSVTPGKAGAGGEAEVTPKALDRQIEFAQRTVDVKGTFSAAALRGMGAGDSLADFLGDKIKDQTKEVKKTNEKLDKINENVKDKSKYEA